MKILKVFFVLCVLTSVIGCSWFKWLEKTAANRYGAEPMVENAKIAPVDLVTLLDPENKAAEPKAAGPKPPAIEPQPTKPAENKAAEPNPPAAKPWADIKDKEKLNLAFDAFYKYDGGDAEKLKIRRDRLQDRLLSASNEQCREFKLMVKLQRDIPADLIPAAVTTITAGLGAIFTPVNTVRALSGSAAIVSGIRAEALQTIYADKAIQVLTAAIDVRRKKKLEEIEPKRARGIKDYTVEAAISDATEYHAGCTLIAALEEISGAIEKEGSTSPVLAITTVSPLPDNRVNAPYKEMLVATGGKLPYSWTITEDKPGWLDLDEKTGVLSGTPTEIKKFDFTVQVTDSAGAMDKKRFTLSIN